MTKAQGRGNAALFLTENTGHLTPKKTSQRRKRAAESGLVDGIVDGERAHLYVPTEEPLERANQIRIVAALSVAGVRILQHRVFPCWKCSARPMKDTGLGRFVSDILCIVPPYGRACFIEVKREKTRNAKRDANQREWAKWIRHYGGVAGTATNEDEALALVALARVAP